MGRPPKPSHLPTPGHTHIPFQVRNKLALPLGGCCYPCLAAKSCLTLVTPWGVACHGMSMGCPRQEYWDGLPFPPPGDLPNPGIEPESPALAGGSFTTVLLGKIRAQASGFKMTCHREDIPFTDLIHIFHSLKSDILLGTSVNWLQMTVLALRWIHGLC